MKVTFLGCKGSIQTEHDLNTSLLFEHQGNSILIDCSGSLSVAVDANVSDIVITHEHIDHVYGLVSLLHQMWLSGRKEKLTIHAKGDALKLAMSMIDLFKLKEKKGIFPIELVEISSFSSGEVNIDYFDTDHTPNSFGLVFSSNGKKVVYTSDTRPISTPLEIMMDADLLISEASGLEEDKPSLVVKGHQSGLDAGLLAVSLNAKALQIVHLPKSQEKSLLIENEAREVFPSAKNASPLGEIEVL